MGVLRRAPLIRGWIEADEGISCQCCQFFSCPGPNPVFKLPHNLPVSFAFSLSMLHAKSQFPIRKGTYTIMSEDQPQLGGALGPVVTVTRVVGSAVEKPIVHVDAQLTSLPDGPGSILEGGPVRNTKGRL
jgi:hypothetical protein